MADLSTPDVSITDRLNDRQREAATHGHRPSNRPFTSGPLLIIAGAGTGKTNTLAHRVAHLVLEGATPERILLLTFSRRAAAEMTRRTQKIVADAIREVRLPWSGTFHSIANRLIRRHSAQLGLDETFSVLDRGDAADLMDVVRHDLDFSKAHKRFPRKDTCLAIYSHRVNTQGTLQETLDQHFPWCAEWEGELTRLYRAYVEKKLANQALDYDDLLLYWHAMMSEEAIAEEIGGRFDHVLVDEYQDTNTLQAQILKLMKPDGTGVTVVGDDAQAIYSFRAATVENILGFPEQYEGARIVTLEENFRSTQGVLDAANALIHEGDRQYRKTLTAKKGAGAKPKYVTVADDQAQAEYVVENVLSTREKGVALKRQAVLFRSSHHSDVLELELARRNIPYVKYGGLKFLEAAHVKDLLSVLRWADNPKNRIAAFRALQILPGMGPATAERVITRFEAGSYEWKAIGALQSNAPYESRRSDQERRLGGSAAQQSIDEDRRLGGSAAHETDRRLGGSAAHEMDRRLGGSAAHEMDRRLGGSAAQQSFDEFTDLMLALANPGTPWQGQVQRVREWFEPHLERIYEAAHVRAGDLVQLERLSQQHASREQFLSELALDPPQAAGDLSGAPYLDEDYLVLSTIHSAKGQEWDAVHILNVADGNFPNEFATGSAGQTEEERRLLYVAMTRAKHDLHLVAPLKYYVNQQPRRGDKHVYGAKSRFITRAVMAQLEPVVWPEGVGAETGHNQGRARVDVAGRLRGMWT